MASLFERHRPQSYEQVVGQDRAVKILRRLSAGGRAFWLSGPSGSGKTTLARIKAAEFCESWSIDEIDAQDCTLDYLRAMEASFAYRGLGEKTGKAWIVNEAHGLRGPILSRFLTLIERLPEHCVIFFTTTHKGQASLFADYDDAGPLLSRCTQIPMEWHGLAPHVPSNLTRAFAAHALKIARAEGLDGQPMAEYEKLALKCGHNLRLMLSKIEAGEMIR
jgi:replication-associated recombination protein RarA